MTSSFEYLNQVGTGLGQFADVVKEGQAAKLKRDAENAPLADWQRLMLRQLGNDIGANGPEESFPGNRIGGVDTQRAAPVAFEDTFKTNKEFNQGMGAADYFKRSYAPGERAMLQRERLGARSNETAVKEKGLGGRLDKTLTQKSTDQAANRGLRDMTNVRDNDTRRRGQDKSVEAAKARAAGVGSTKPNAEKLKAATSNVNNIRNAIAKIQSSIEGSTPEGMKALNRLRVDYAVALDERVKEMEAFHKEGKVPPAAVEQDDTGDGGDYGDGAGDEGNEELMSPEPAPVPSPRAAPPAPARAPAPAQAAPPRTPVAAKTVTEVRPHPGNPGMVLIRWSDGSITKAGPDSQGRFPVAGPQRKTR